MEAFWDERYRQEAYAHGKDPNEYLKAKLHTLKSGSILFPAEGEGRNAVFAAKLGCNVSAFDISIEGKKEALRLAQEEGVEIKYQTTSSCDLPFREEAFDAIVLIQAHFPKPVCKEYFSQLNQLLKKGGTVIFEGFASRHPEYQKMNPGVGGPKTEEMLFSGIRFSGIS